METVYWTENVQMCNRFPPKICLPPSALPTGSAEGGTLTRPPWLRLPSGRLSLGGLPIAGGVPKETHTVRASDGTLPKTGSGGNPAAYGPRGTGLSCFCFFFWGGGLGAGVGLLVSSGL